jgi:GT2 family glycosyltransferase
MPPDPSLPNVSIVIPVYAMEEELATLLRTLSDQNYPQHKIDVIIVDNNVVPSIVLPDDVAENVTVIRAPERGSYAARNAGLAVAQHDVVAFTDADCIPDPDWLVEGVQHLLQIDGRITAGAIEVYTAPRPNISELHERLFAFRQSDYVEQGYGATANLFIRRSDLVSIGLFDARLMSGGDMELGKRATGLGFSYGYCSSAVVRHPARRSPEELKQKMRRTIAGQVCAARFARENREIVRIVVRTLLPPVRFWWQIGRERGLPVRSRLGLAALRTSLRYVGLRTALHHSLFAGAVAPRE